MIKGNKAQVAMFRIFILTRIYMDSTTHNVIIDTLQLHLLGYKLTQLQNIIERKPQIPSVSIWVPFFSSVVGGVLVWLGQLIERKSRKKVEKNNSLLEIYSYCVKLEAEMKNNYRELAMAKVHVEYWWHCHNSPSSLPEHLPKYYDEHLRSQAYAREIERRIGDTKASYIGHVRKFQVIKQIEAELELEAISNLKNAKAKRYDFSLDHDVLRGKLVEQDEIELADIYYENIISFKQINDRLKSVLKFNYK